MAKVHELLAVNGSLKMQADKVRSELMHTFEKKTHLFTEKIVSYKPAGEGDIVVESQLDLQSTVPRELVWISEFLAKSLDVSYQLAEANTRARADVVLDEGEPAMLSQIPATSLLELEKRCKELLDFVTKIPTLDPASGFAPDPSKGAGIFRARDDKRGRTKKVSKPMTLAKATDKHAEQVQLVTEDVIIGELTTMEWSGLLTTADKGDMLSRVEKLTRAVRKARSRANETNLDTTGMTIGTTLINYVFGL